MYSKGREWQLASRLGSQLKTWSLDLPPRGTSHLAASCCNYPLATDFSNADAPTKAAKRRYLDGPVCTFDNQDRRCFFFLLSLLSTKPKKNIFFINYFSLLTWIIFLQQQVGASQRPTAPSRHLFEKWITLISFFLFLKFSIFVVLDDGDFYFISVASLWLWLQTIRQR